MPQVVHVQCDIIFQDNGCVVMISSKHKTWILILVSTTILEVEKFLCQTWVFTKLKFIKNW
jgi:hypothetical protein